jgi:hypothetical protein
MKPTILINDKSARVEQSFYAELREKYNGKAVRHKRGISDCENELECIEVKEATFHKVMEGVGQLAYYTSETKKRKVMFLFNHSKLDEDEKEDIVLFTQNNDVSLIWNDESLPTAFKSEPAECDESQVGFLNESIKNKKLFNEKEKLIQKQADQEQKKVSKKIDKQLKDKVKETQALTLLEALDINAETYYDLKTKTRKNKKLNQEELLSVEKFELCKLYNVNADDLSIEFIKYYHNLKIKGIYLRLQRGYKIPHRDDSFLKNVCDCNCCINGTTDPIDKLTCFKDAQTIKDNLFGKDALVKCHLANRYLFKICGKKLIDAIGIVVPVSEFTTWVDDVISESVEHLIQTQKLFLGGFDHSYKEKSVDVKLRFINCVFNQVYGSKWKTLYFDKRNTVVSSYTLEMQEYFLINENLFKVNIRKFQ